MVAWIVTLAMTVVCATCRPTHLRCPPGWYDYDGVRSSGQFTCGPVPVGDTPPRGPDPSVQSSAKIRARIYCTGGTHPIVDWDGRGVGCQR